MNPMIWLAIIIVLLIIEIVTLGLTTIWFAGGALVACLASFFGVDEDECGECCWSGRDSDRSH